MNYSEHEPSPFLKPHISCYWIIKGDGTDAGRIPFITMGGLEFVINLGDFQIIEDDRNARAHLKHGMVLGPMVEPKTICGRGKIHWIGASFRPGSALTAFLDIGMRDLADSMITFNDIWGHGNQVLVSQCMNARHRPNDLIGLLNHYFLNKLNSATHDGLVNFALESISSQNGQVRVEDLIRETGLSRSQFTRRFNQKVGLTPKQFCRLERMRHTLHRFFSETTGSLATLALECGFYDQAHFNREFSAFTGQSPSAIKERISDLGQLLLAPTSAREQFNENTAVMKKSYHFAS